MKLLSGGGIEYGADGAVINGVFYLVLLRKKILTPYPYSQSIGYYSINQENPVINDFLQKIIKILKLNNCLFHADLIMDGNQHPFIIELSPRPSGHNLHNNFTVLSTGIDMIEQYLNFSLQKPFNFIPKKVKNLLIRYFNFENCRITQIPDFEKIKDKYNILDYKINLPKEQLSIVKDGHSIMDRGYFILENNSEDNLQKSADEILSMFKKEN